MKQEPKFTAMAEVLLELGSEVEALGELLCRDETFAARHVRELQAIDLIAQKQRVLASIIASGFSEEEMRRISLDALHKRFCGFLDGETSFCEIPIGNVDTSRDSLGLWD